MTKAVKTPATVTSAKLDMLDCISMDPRISAAEFRVAFRLMQHANGETGAIFPSQERLADQTGLRERTVRACIAGLIQKKWLTRCRPNKRLPNFYKFDGRHMNAILDRQANMTDARKQAKAITYERHVDDGQKRLSGIRVPVVSGIPMTLNTVRRTPEESLSTEGGDYTPTTPPQERDLPTNAYSRAKGKVA